MPWRRYARLLERLEKDRGSTLSSPQYLHLMELLLERAWALLRLVALVCVFLLVITVGLGFQVTARNRQIDQVQRTVDRAEASSRRAEAAAKESQKLLTDPTRTDALAAILRIEWHLCSGPCPAPPGG